MILKIVICKKPMLGHWLFVFFSRRELFGKLSLGLLMQNATEGTLNQYISLSGTCDVFLGNRAETSCARQGATAERTLSQKVRPGLFWVFSTERYLRCVFRQPCRNELRKARGYYRTDSEPKSQARTLLRVRSTPPLKRLASLSTP